MVEEAAEPAREFEGPHKIEPSRHRTRASPAATGVAEGAAPCLEEAPGLRPRLFPDAIQV